MENINNTKKASNPETKVRSYLHNDEDIPTYKDSIVYGNIEKSSLNKLIHPSYAGHTPPSLDEVSTFANNERSREHLRNLGKITEKLKEGTAQKTPPTKAVFNRFKSQNPPCR